MTFRQLFVSTIIVATGQIEGMCLQKFYQKYINCCSPVHQKPEKRVQQAPRTSLSPFYVALLTGKDVEKTSPKECPKFLSFAILETIEEEWCEEN
jgi:hypothetical protein